MPLQLFLTLNIIVALALAKTKKNQRYPKKEFLHAAAMIFSIKNNSSGIAIFPAVWEGYIFMETGVHGWGLLPYKRTSGGFIFLME